MGLAGNPPVRLALCSSAQLSAFTSPLQATVERLYVGPFMTSLGMHGLSVTLLRGVDDTVLQLLDAPTEVGCSLAMGQHVVCRTLRHKYAGQQRASPASALGPRLARLRFIDACVAGPPVPLALPAGPRLALGSSHLCT